MNIIVKDYITGQRDVLGGVAIEYLRDGGTITRTFSDGSKIFVGLKEDPSWDMPRLVQVDAPGRPMEFEEFEEFGEDWLDVAEDHHATNYIN